MPHISPRSHEDGACQSKHPWALILPAITISFYRNEIPQKRPQPQTASTGNTFFVNTDKIHQSEIKERDDFLVTTSSR